MGKMDRLFFPLALLATMSTGEVCWDLIGSCNKCLLRPQLERSVFDDSAFCHTRCSSTKKLQQCCTTLFPFHSASFNSSSRLCKSSRYLRTSALSVVCPLVRTRQAQEYPDIPRVFMQLHCFVVRSVLRGIRMWNPGIPASHSHAPQLRRTAHKDCSDSFFWVFGFLP